MEPAERVLNILIDHGCEPGIDIQNAEATKWFVENGLEGAEYLEGMKVAGENGWVVDGSRDGTFQITAEGLDAT